MSEGFDVLIAGGGPVGACAGALLARAAPAASGALRIGILEPQRPAAAAREAAIDLRVSAVSRASERILKSAGAWERIPAERISAYERMRVWHESEAPFSSGALVFDAADAGEPNLGCIIENRLFQAALLDAFESAGGTVLPTEVADLAVGDTGVQVTTSAGTVSTRLLVGADGARSLVRERLGLTVESRSYDQIAIVAAVATARPHERTAWQRFLATGTLAFLPLCDGLSSIVWSVDAAAAAPLLQASPEEFSAQLERAADGVLGVMRLASERLSFPLHSLAAHHYAAQRVALIGDAAHVVHPLAGQGVNLGFADAAALAEVVIAAHAGREDVGAQRVLRQYERWRRSETAVMATAIDLFNRFLAHGSGPLSRLAQRGLAIVNRSPEVKRIFMARALGTSGHLPRAALARGD